MLHEFIAVNRDEIISRCRLKVARRSTPPPTVAEIDHGVPPFLDQLVEELRLESSSTPRIQQSAVQHGNDLLRRGYSVSQVVNDYGDVCQSITELALEMNTPISTDDFRMLNRCLDVAIAAAVTEFERASNESTVDAESARGTEQFGFLAHELRNLIHTAMIAFEVLKSGNVGVAGSTGTVLHRSLLGAYDLIGRSLTAVRLTHGVQRLEQFQVSAFIEELTAAARLAAEARGITLSIGPIPEGVAIEADRQVLGAVVMNLLQNAFKFTRPRSRVILRVDTSDDRVLFEVQDECGGLPDGEGDELFRPFEQRSADRSGLGLGLAFSRWAVSANNGRISSRNLPGTGCVFAVDLPRLSVAVVPAG